MRRSKHIGYTNDWIDFCGDGRFRKPRIKGKDKFHMKKWRRRLEKDEERKEIENYKTD